MKKYIIALVSTIIIHALIAGFIYTRYLSVKPTYELQNDISDRYFKTYGSPETLDQQILFEYIIYGEIEIEGTSFKVNL